MRLVNDSIPSTRYLPRAECVAEMQFYIDDLGNFLSALKNWSGTATRLQEPPRGEEAGPEQSQPSLKVSDAF